mmetsp:Transcript_54953/g.119735  ORF Transcript_54953/g.119735 Transcript_54953/m.119735 type:complete len:257 (+) Transcript_54953:213-983(+)
MSPRMEPREPVKEKKGSGTGMGTFTPTCPTSISCTYLRAAAPEEVKMAQPLPYLEELVNAIASSSVSSSRETSTGPKISSLYAGFSLVTPCSQEGPTKLPLSKPGTLTPRPSNRHLAPCWIPCSIRDSTLALEALVISGPTSVEVSMPGPVFSLRARSTSSGIHSLDSPTKMTVERAMQRWPAAPKAAARIAFRVASLLASGSTVAWFLAPRLACTRLPLAVPRAWMYSPAMFPPTKEMARTAGASHRKFTVSCPP